MPVIVYTRNEFDAVADGVRSLVRQGVDGLLMLGMHPAVAESLIERKLHGLIPTVFLNLDLPRAPGVHCVKFDYRTSCEEMARCFRRLAVRRIHTFFYDAQDPWSTHFQDELMRLKKKRVLSFTLSRNIHRVDVLNPEKAVGSRFADVYAELQAMKEPPDLLIFESTPCAMACLPLLAERGWKIPEQVRVFSFSAGDVQDSCLPVSSIQPDFPALANAAAGVLEKVIRQPRIGSISETVPAHFIFRDQKDTGCPAPASSSGGAKRAPIRIKQQKGN